MIKFTNGNGEVFESKLIDGIMVEGGEKTPMKTDYRKFEKKVEPAVQIKPASSPVSVATNQPKKPKKPVIQGDAS